MSKRKCIDNKIIGKYEQIIIVCTAKHQIETERKLSSSKYYLS